MSVWNGHLWCSFGLSALRIWLPIAAACERSQNDVICNSLASCELLQKKITGKPQSCAKLQQLFNWLKHVPLSCEGRNINMCSEHTWTPSVDWLSEFTTKNIAAQETHYQSSTPKLRYNRLWTRKNKYPFAFLLERGGGWTTPLKNHLSQSVNLPPSLLRVGEI